MQIRPGERGDFGLGKPQETGEDAMREQSRRYWEEQMAEQERLTGQLQQGFMTAFDIFTTRGKDATKELGKYMMRMLVQEVMGKLAGALANALTGGGFGLAKVAGGTVLK
jgi:hypothetical protein